MYTQYDGHSSKDELKFQVIHHKRYFQESFETLNSQLDKLLEHAYSGNIVETIRAVRAFKEETEKLSSHADHLLLMIEKLAEPDHGGE